MDQSLDVAMTLLEDTARSSKPGNRLLIVLNHLFSSLKLIWGFTESDFSTFVIPNTAFGTLGALATGRLTDAALPSTSKVLQRLPVVLVFNWSNLLIFDLANQRSPGSIAEDRVNKPWRPIPSNKITTEQTRRLMLITIPLSLYLNHYLDVWGQGAVIHLITWLYNDLGGSDEVVVREMLIAVGYAMFNSSSLYIASGCSQDNCGISPQGLIWTGIISAVIFTTMQVQDLKDQEGDRLRGRRTVVLFFGERFSRVSIALSVILWSWVCAHFWKPGLLGYVLSMVPGLLVAWCVVGRRIRDQDRQTWKLWCLWLIFLYVLPILHT